MTNPWDLREPGHRQTLAFGHAEFAAVTDGVLRDVWTDLVGGLVDARTDPATARFDAELAAALADGSLAEDVAHRLRFWQRASVRVLVDHVMTVLPVAVGALDAARRDADAYAEGAAATLAAATPAPTTSDGGPVELDPALVEQAVPDEEAVRRASTSERGRPSTLEEVRPRLLVAELVTAQERNDRTS